MLNLASETAPGWVDRIWPHIDTLLVDHAHCEKKAAGSAVNLMFRYPHIDAILNPLSAIAREELEHFDLVLDVIRARGIRFARLEPSPYAGRLHKALRPGDPGRLIDSLLICALIEARSCERMKLLAEGLPDPGLAAFYGDLLESEARHFSTYVHMAEALAPRADIQARLRELAVHEAAVIADAPDEPRMHN
ncbi:MAG: tRNA-(ms[2]io[6]A)-hydroxylase [Alphaproteobacteria bacterium]|nr:tRNA-(ms[2]io[6]A)-hydroxylase [Alphaproteobacteria bacterium]